MREVQNAFCKRNYWMWTYWIILYLSAGISWDKGQKVVFFFLEPTITGLATKTIPRNAPLPTEHSKNYDISWDWLQSPSEHWTSLCSSLFFGSMGKGLSMGKQSIRKTCRCPVMRHPLLQNTWTSWFGVAMENPQSQRSFFENWSSVIVFHWKGDKCASRVPWRMPARGPLCWMVMHRVNDFPNLPAKNSGATQSIHCFVSPRFCTSLFLAILCLSAKSNVMRMPCFSKNGKFGLAKMRGDDVRCTWCKTFIIDSLCCLRLSASLRRVSFHISSECFLLQ